MFMRAQPRRLGYAALSTLLLLLAPACNDEGGVDRDRDPAEVPDADDQDDEEPDDEKPDDEKPGTKKDAAVEKADAGDTTPKSDAGSTPPKSDAGSSSDAGSPSMDAGGTPDANTPTSDAGDAGTAGDAGPVDAGSLCPALPTKFALSGCGLPALCHLKQNGCNWEAKCGTRTLTGSGAAANATSFAGFTHPDGRACTLKITNGTVSGSCEGGDAGMCTFTTNANPLPTPFCVDLPSKLTALNICSTPPAGAQNFSAQECDVVQNACSFQASCNAGADIISGTVTSDGLRWDTAYGYRCTGVLANGSVTGNCVQRTGVPDGGTPNTCPMTLTAAPTAPADCAQDLPSKGFIVNGCSALAGAICHVSQRGCIWQASCGTEVFSGRAPASGKYTFKTRLGAACEAKVEAGVFKGECKWGAGESCQFSGDGIATAPGASCYAAPAAGFESSGCGADMTCVDLIQSGCDWQSRCTFGGSTRIYYGKAVANGLKFPSGNYECWAYKEATGERLVGGCSTNGTETSQCSARVNNGALFLDPTPPAAP
jgi:hypothetical protein